MSSFLHQPSPKKRFSENVFPACKSSCRAFLCFLSSIDDMFGTRDCRRSVHIIHDSLGVLIHLSRRAVIKEELQQLRHGKGFQPFRQPSWSTKIPAADVRLSHLTGHDRCPNYAHKICKSFFARILEADVRPQHSLGLQHIFRLRYLELCNKH